MLSGLDLQIVAFYRQSYASYFCRPCTVRHVGEHTVQRLTTGLSAGCPDWDRALHWQVAEQAVDNGYEYATGEDGKSDPDCAEVWCYDCGTRLDDEPGDD